MAGTSDCLPPWLERLRLGEKFFIPCRAHKKTKKNDRNAYCLDCCSALCLHCLPAHRSHRLLQIRRYVYREVVRVDDLEKLIDCASVQRYKANGAMVVFLNEREQGRHARPAAGGGACSACGRSLSRYNLYCSLLCKVSRLVESEAGVAPHLRECELLPLPASALDGNEPSQLSRDSVLDSHSSSGSGFVSSKKDSGEAASPTSTVASGRKRSRKGIPRRAPRF